VQSGGSGSESTSDVVSVNSRNAEGGRSNSTAIVRRDRPFSEQAEVELYGSGGRIRLPAFRSGNDAWIDLRNVAFTANEITASADHGMRMRIDRVSGAISVDGSRGTFGGRCEVFNSSGPQKF
jgi:hypothetical protein